MFEPAPLPAVDALPMNGNPTRRGQRLAVIVLTLGSTLEDGTEVQHDTWACGPTVNEALKQWVKNNVVLAKLVIARRVVTSGEPLDRPESERKIVGSSRRLWRKTRR